MMSMNDMNIRLTNVIGI